MLKPGTGPINQPPCPTLTSNWSIVKFGRNCFATCISSKFCHDIDLHVGHDVHPHVSHHNVLDSLRGLRDADRMEIRKCYRPTYGRTDWRTYRAYILKARIAGFKIPQKKLNFPQICPNMPRIGPKMAKNDSKCPKVNQILPQMAQNGPTWP